MKTARRSLPSPNTPVDVGELRQDVITGKWVAVATQRGQRPHDFAAERRPAQLLPAYQDDCPFCNLDKFPQEPDVLRLPDDPEHWSVHIFPNKYPAFSPEEEFRVRTSGPYRAMEATGYHELLAPRYHNRLEGLISRQELALQLEALVLRYRQLKVKSSVNYIQIIRNHGAEAGGSLVHPHHQIFAIPVLPSDVTDILRGAEDYFQKHGKEVFEVMLAFERAEKTRVVWENDLFTVFCPFASRARFEMWVMPRYASAHFEDTGPQQRQALAAAMQQALGRLYGGLNDPPFNYYIYSAPCDDTGFVCDLATFQHFRWHIQILPRFAKFGGFELSTGLEITTALPEESAAFLRDLPDPVHSVA